MPAGLQLGLQRMEDFRPPAHRLGDRPGADRHHHELLEVDRVVGVCAAVDDVHHRHRQQVGGDAADIGMQRQPARIGRRLGDGETDAKDGIGPQPRLVRRAVEFDHRRVDFALLLGVDARQRVEDLAIDRFAGLADAFAAITCRVAVTLLDRLVRPRRCPRRNGGATERPVFQHDVDLDRRVAAAIENLAGVDVDDRGHDCPFGCAMLHCAAADAIYRLGSAAATHRCRNVDVEPGRTVSRLRGRSSPSVQK